MEPALLWGWAETFCLLCHIFYYSNENSIKVVPVTWYLPSTLSNLEPTAIHNSSSVQEGCEDTRFKQRAVIEFLTAEKISPIDIHHHMQAVYRDKCVDVSKARCRVHQFKQEEVGKTSLCDKVRPGQNSNLVKHWQKCTEVGGYYVEKWLCTVVNKG